jgi:hypothetical protein
MTRDDAKIILLRCRPGTKDEEEPEVREALALANSDVELSRWFAEEIGRQQLVRKTLRKINAPAGLMEQIISEQAAKERMMRKRREVVKIAVLMGVIIFAGFWGFLQQGHRPKADNTLATFQNEMAGYALRGYIMDLQTNNPEQIRAFFRQRQAPSDYAISRGLQKAALVGCSVENWNTTKVSMICFATGAQLAPGNQNDLWLFVVDQKSVADAPRDSQRIVSKVNRLNTATWSENGKLYLLATTADQAVFKSYF